MFPKEYREAEEWAKIWVAYALQYIFSLLVIVGQGVTELFLRSYIFVGSSNGTEVLNILKG
jgi:hypothetical protein